MYILGNYDVPMCEPVGPTQKTFSQMAIVKHLRFHHQSSSLAMRSRVFPLACPCCISIGQMEDSPSVEGILPTLTFGSDFHRMMGMHPIEINPP